MLLSCPSCAAEFDLATLLSTSEERSAFAALVGLASPLRARLAQYLALHKPPKQRLTPPKALRLLQPLLADIDRRAIAHKGREWAAPPALWESAIEQVLSLRDGARLELPLKGHGYLYAVLAGMADKHEAAQEAQREQDARLRPQRAGVQLHGQALTVQEALGAGIVPMSLAPQRAQSNPALAALDERDRCAAPMPAGVRAQLAQIKKSAPPKKGA